MHPVDWVVVVAFTTWIVYDGLKRTKDSDEIEGYFESCPRTAPPGNSPVCTLK